jgi:DNA replication protein DnaC
MYEGQPYGENPFSTRRVRPGAVDYCFTEAAGLEELIDRFQRNLWRGEIVGPHGSGKSTLLYSFLTAIQQTGRNPILFELHNGQRRLPKGWRQKIELSALSGPAIVVVDGYEQLNGWNRFWLNRYCRYRHVGLLVTSHSSVGMPELFRTSPSIETAHKVVERLMQHEQTKFSTDLINELFEKHRGNIRELLFDLYDMYEQQNHKNLK